jgi:hypothetical protein
MKRWLAGAWIAAALPALAQAPADCPSAAQFAQQHLIGTWKAEVEGERGTYTLVLAKHPEFAESVRGTMERAGKIIQLAGDVDEGELTLEESANGVNISATWLGAVVVGSCGREMRGQWKAEGSPRTHHFVLRKQVGSSSATPWALPIALRSQIQLVFDGDGRVVGETLGLVDRFAARELGDRRRRQMVVQAPAHVLGVGLTAVAPPRVTGLGGFRLELAVDIDQPRL